MCQPHANAVSRSTPKWDEGTRVDGGFLELAEPAAKEGIELKIKQVYLCFHA